MATMSQMRLETQQAPDKVKIQHSNNTDRITHIAKRWHQHQPVFAATIARGSSDHAASFAKYVLETQCGLATVSLASSVHTLYQAPLQLEKSVVLAISQSGGSADIGAMLTYARERGALTIALVNEIESPLAEIAEFVIPLYAGKELSVAATKSYILTLTGLLQLMATVTNNASLLSLLLQLPDYLEQALQCDWSGGLEVFASAKTSLVIGRGYTFPIVQEAALKFKEVVRLQAEAFSSAEVLHGPFALLKPGYPMLVFLQQDATQRSIRQLIQCIHQIGGHVCVVTANNLIDSTLTQTARHLFTLPPSMHPLCDPIIAIQSFYCFVEQLARNLGYDPDQPPHLQKITNTF